MTVTRPMVVGGKAAPGTRRPAQRHQQASDEPLYLPVCVDKNSTTKGESFACSRPSPPPHSAWCTPSVSVGSPASVQATQLAAITHTSHCVSTRNPLERAGYGPKHCFRELTCSGRAGSLCACECLRLFRAAAPACTGLASQQQQSAGQGYRRRSAEGCGLQCVSRVAARGARGEWLNATQDIARVNTAAPAAPPERHRIATANVCALQTVEALCCLG